MDPLGLLFGIGVVLLILAIASTGGDK